MYHFAKRLTTIASIIGYVNAIVVLLFAFYFPGSGLDGSTIIIMSFYLVSTCALILLLNFALRGLCDSLEFNFVKDAEKTQELEKRIHFLEETK